MKKTAKKLLAMLFVTAIVFTFWKITGIEFTETIPKAQAGGEINLPEYSEGGYIYTIYKNESYIIGCDETVVGDIMIPEELGGYAVVSINSSAFYKNTRITGVTFPDSVRQICYGAFYGCSNLEKITLHDNICRIDQDAFIETNYAKDLNNWNDGALYIGNHLIKVKKTIGANFVIKSGTVGIANEAFLGCENLTELIIPNGVRYIGNYALWDCTSISFVHIPRSVSSIDYVLLNNNTSVYICSETSDCYAKTYAEEHSIEFRLCNSHDVVENESTTKPTTGADEEEIIKKPSTSTINYGETLVLHADFTNIPADAKIEWGVVGNGVTIKPSADGKTCAVTSTATGDATITAKYVDADGVEHIAEQEIESNASIWQKIVSFFKNLFGINRTIEQAVSI